MIKHTQKYFSFVLGLCVALFLGVNSALSAPLTYTLQADCDLRTDVNQRGISHTINGTDINWTIPAGGIDILIEPCFTGGTARDTACSASFAGADRLYFDDDSYGICSSGIGCFLSSSLGGSGLYGCATNLTTPQPQTPPNATTSNLILDQLMPSVATTFFEFLTQLFRDYWPYTLVLAIVVAFIKAFEKFFNRLIK